MFFALAAWMLALPPSLDSSDDDQVTGIGCPHCPGVMQARMGPDGASIRFRCRIGHVLSLDELLEAKEGRAEDRVWAAVLAFEELAVLYADLSKRTDCAPSPVRKRAYRTRCEAARGVAAALRALIERDQPVDLSSSA